MSDIIYHDADHEGHWPTRTYRCSVCNQAHQFERLYGDIPKESPCCGTLMHRAYDIDGAPDFVVRTEIRDVRHKLRREEQEGKRPRAIDKDLNPHFAKV